MSKLSLKKPKVHYYQVESGDISVQHETQTAIIHEAYFGRRPLGLNIWINYRSCGSSFITYGNMGSIEGLMDDFEVDKLEELKGREIVAHIKRSRLIGLSIPETQ